MRTQSLVLNLTVLALLLCCGMSAPTQGLNAYSGDDIIAGSCVDTYRLKAGSTYIVSGTTQICNTETALIINIDAQEGYQNVVEAIKIEIEFNHGDIVYNQIGHYQFKFNPLKPDGGLEHIIIPFADIQLVTEGDMASCASDNLAIVIHIDGYDPTGEAQTIFVGGPCLAGDQIAESTDSKGNAQRWYCQIVYSPQCPPPEAPTCPAGQSCQECADCVCTAAGGCACPTGQTCGIPPVGSPTCPPDQECIDCQGLQNDACMCDPSTDSACACPVGSQCGQVPTDCNPGQNCIECQDNEMDSPECSCEGARCSCPYGQKCGVEQSCPTQPPVTDPTDPTPPRAGVQGYHQCQQTAFGYGSQPLDNNRWGWVQVLTAGTEVTNNIYEGAGRNVISDERKIGTITALYDGTSVSVSVDFDAQHYARASHFYWSSEQPATIAPGRYGNIFHYTPPTTGGQHENLLPHISHVAGAAQVYFIAHFESCFYVEVMQA